MIQPIRFVVEPAWKLVLKDLGVDSSEIIQRAKLPVNLFVKENASLSVEEYFRFWEALASTASTPLFSLRLGQSVSPEIFNPPMFAALCSPNLNVAIARLGDYKKLCGPSKILVKEEKDYTTVSFECLFADIKVPNSYVATELVFLVYLIRLATREQIKPLSVISTADLITGLEYAEYFGIKPEIGKINQLKFTAKDANRPFLSQNNGMWNFFEPELKKRLADVEAKATFAERVGVTLFELIPSGLCTTDAVAKKLAVSKRTLQRNLTNEKTSFQLVLNSTREKLAKHYLVNSNLSSEAISFLLGFDDPNSFARAFRSWTGFAPGKMRREAIAQ